MSVGETMVSPTDGKELIIMEKIDFRHNYVLVCDTETANTLTDENGKMDMSSVLMYDCGWCVMDTRGNVYKEQSFINKDIFEGEKDLMQSAYYAKKIPQYLEDLASGKRKLATTYEIRQAMLADMEKYHIHVVVAHNARFDVNALNGIQRWTTKSRFRYWFPYGTEVWDTMKMARDVIHKMPTYRKFCEENGFLTKNGRLSTTAENLYRFIIKDPDFVESHTGLEDVQIEREIMLYCYKQHKKMRKVLYSGGGDSTSPTDFQKMVMKNIKNF